MYIPIVNKSIRNRNVGFIQSYGTYLNRCFTLYISLPSIVNPCIRLSWQRDLCYWRNIYDTK